MTDRYAVIGNPVSHSKSPQIHALFAAQTGENISYQAIEAPIDVRSGFEDKIEELRKNDYKGCNVTVPFKFNAFKIADQLSERALSAQAVNTLSFEDEVIRGDNTDGAGLVRDIENNLGFDLRDKNVLLMGAGGAASGVVLPLLLSGAELTVANRTDSRAHEMVERFAHLGRVFASSYDDLSGQCFDIVINATSAGLTDSEVPLPPGIFAPGALAYDMMYGRETPFMAFARQQGAAVADGLGMLVEQAAEAFYLWRGVRPDTASVIARLRTPQ